VLFKYNLVVGEKMLFNTSEDCQICKYIRWYFMIGMPIVFFVWMAPEVGFIRELNLANIAATGIIIGLICVVGWKYYHERR
jgi:hypothetical protein